MKLLRLKSVIEKVGLGRSTIYSLIKNNEFPAQIHLTQATSVWIEAEIDQWIRERVSEARPNSSLAAFRKATR